MKVGIFFGSSTGNTKNIAFLIYKKIKKYIFCNIFDISKIDFNIINDFDILILGSSTWYYGKLQYHWYNFFYYNKKFIIKNKIICFFGCGDKLNYKYTFCDGLFCLYKRFNVNNIIIGYWFNIYKFKNSKSLLFKKYFLGLIIDDNNKYKKNIKIINIWVSNLLLKILNY